jgi:hypothetical protein
VSLVSVTQRFNTTTSMDKAATKSRLPDGMGVARLFDLPTEWSRQRKVLGLAAQ